VQRPTRQDLMRQPKGSRKRTKETPRSGKEKECQNHGWASLTEGWKERQICVPTPRGPVWRGGGREGGVDLIKNRARETGKR